MQTDSWHFHAANNECKGKDSHESAIFSGLGNWYRNLSILRVALSFHIWPGSAALVIHSMHGLDEEIACIVSKHIHALLVIYFTNSKISNKGEPPKPNFNIKKCLSAVHDQVCNENLAFIIFLCTFGRTYRFINLYEGIIPVGLAGQSCQNWSTYGQWSLSLLTRDLCGCHQKHATAANRGCVCALEAFLGGRVVVVILWSIKLFSFPSCKLSVDWSYTGNDGG